MRRIFSVVLVGCGALLSSTLGWAQYGPNDRYYGNDPYYRGNPSYNGPYGDIGLIDRVLADLQRTRGYGYGRHDWKHAEHAREDLERFRVNWSRGRFDRDRLDRGIGNIQRLVDDRWLNPRDREILSRDLFALRDFRANRDYAPRGWR